MRSIQIPIIDTIIRELKVGDPVLLNGIMITGRDVVHKWMIETFIRKTREPQGDDLQVYQALKPILMPPGLPVLLGQPHAMGVPSELIYNQYRSF